MGDAVDRTFSIAPMMDCTDRFDRYFLRLITPHALLYTEMVTTGAILHGDRDRHLSFHDAEHPVAVQLGGSDPDDLARAAEIAAGYGYDEVNLNVGCPSDRVQSGRFGACLMQEPDLVADCVRAMRAAVSVPVTVKSRIGVDDRDDYEDLKAFVETVAAAGCETFIVHARKAWLKGLSPKQNREIPPLRYAVVHRLKRDFPRLEIIINGGIANLKEAADQLEHVYGVMIGRAAYNDPYMLADAGRALFGDPARPPSRHALLERYVPFVEAELARGVPLQRMTRHILGLFNGCRGARAWRRFLSENACRPGAGIAVIRDAAALVEADPEGAPVRRSALNDCLFETVGDAAFGQVVGRHLDGYLVARQHADAVLAHLAGGMGQDFVFVFQLHTEHRIRKDFDNRSVELNRVFFRHSCDFLPPDETRCCVRTSSRVPAASRKKSPIGFDITSGLNLMRDSLMRVQIGGRTRRRVPSVRRAAFGKSVVANPHAMGTSRLSRAVPIAGPGVRFNQDSARAADNNAAIVWLIA